MDEEEIKREMDDSVATYFTRFGGIFFYLFFIFLFVDL